MKPDHQTKPLSAAEILCDVTITDDPKRLRFNDLPAKVKALVATGRLRGEKLILLEWSNGMQVRTMIPSKDRVPPTYVILQAYHQGLRLQANSNEGDRA